VLLISQPLSSPQTRQTGGTRAAADRPRGAADLRPAPQPSTL